MPDDVRRDGLPVADPPAPPPLREAPPAQRSGGPGWGVRERPQRQPESWEVAAPPAPPTHSAPPAAAPAAPWPGSPSGPRSSGPRPAAPRSQPPSIGVADDPAFGRPATTGSGFPTTTQLIAVLVAAVVVVAGLGAYFFRSHGDSATPALAAPPGGAVAIVHQGPAVLTAQSLSGGHAGRTLQVPGAPDSIVTTPDGRRAFLLDTQHGQVIPVDLAHGTVGAAIAAGKLPTDEQMSPDGATLYVTDNLSGAVIPIDTASGSPGPAQQLVQGVASFVPAPAGSGAVISVFNGTGQPGILAFVSPTTGLGAAIAVGMNSPREVFYSRDGATVWVVESGVGNRPGAVYPVDVSSHGVGRPIAVGHSPGGSGMSPDGRLLVVTNSLDGTVTVVDLARRAAVATIPVGAAPERAEVSSDGATAWVTTVLDRTLVPVDLRSNRAGAPVSLTNAPSDLAIPRGSSSAWVLFPSSAGNVTFLGAGNAIGHPTKVGNAPNLVIAADGGSAWAANSLSDTVQRVDMSGRDSGPPIRVARAPGDLALTRDHRTLLVLSFGDGIHPGFLTPIDTASSKAGTALDVGAAPTALTLSPDGSTAYVANHQSNSLALVDLRRGVVSGRIALPCSPSQQVITPDGVTLYVACSASAVVLPVSTANHAVGAPISVGASPSLVMGNQGKVVFVNADHVLQEIEVATNKVILSKDETGNLISISATPDDATLVAVENTGGAVLFLHAANLATTTSLSVGSRPGGLALTADGSRGYVLDTGQQKLYVIDVAAARVAATLDASPSAASVIVASHQP